MATTKMKWYFNHVAPFLNLKIRWVTKNKNRMSIGIKAG
jgi:hypothetical protein